MPLCRSPGGALLAAAFTAALLGQLFPQGSGFPAQHFVLSLGLVLGQLGAGGICNVVLDLAAHVLGAAGALAVLVQIIHGAEHRRLGHREILVLVQQLCDVLVQLFGQRLNVFFRIRRCNGIRRPRNVHPYFVDHVSFPLFILYLPGTQGRVFLHFTGTSAPFPVTFSVFENALGGVSRHISAGITPQKTFRGSVLPSIII